MKKILLFLLLMPLCALYSQSIIWEQSYGGSEYDKSNAMQQTSDGGYIMGGLSYSSDIDVSNNNGIADYWIVKADAFGNIEWEQNYGGPSWDFLFALQQTTDGGYILAGQAHAEGGDVGGFYGVNDY